MKAICICRYMTIAVFSYVFHYPEWGTCQTHAQMTPGSSQNIYKNPGQRFKNKCRHKTSV